jgi:hypothetical protein
MIAGLSPAYVRRDEPGHPENWVLYSPVLDPEADRDEAAYTINQSKHRQPDLRQAVLMPYFQLIHGPLTLNRMPPKGTHLECRDAGRVLLLKVDPSRQQRVFGLEVM